MSLCSVLTCSCSLCDFSAVQDLLLEAPTGNLPLWLFWFVSLKFREKFLQIFEKTLVFLVGQICAKFRPNCSLSVKSMKFGTETVFKMTKKIGYGGKPEIAVLPS